MIEELLSYKLKPMRLIVSFSNQNIFQFKILPIVMILIGEQII